MSKDELRWLKWGRNAALIFGIVTLGISTIFMILGESYIIPQLVEAAKFVGTFGLGIFALGIAAHSMIISIESDKKRAAQIEESDKKIQAISNAYFIELIDNFRDYSLGCSMKEDDDSDKYHERNDFYKWRTDLKKTMEFKQWANSDQQTALTHLFIFIFENLPWDKEILTNYDVRHFLGMCGRIIEFEMINDDKDKFDQLLSVHIGKRQGGEEYIPFINRKITELKPKDVNAIFKKT